MLTGLDGRGAERAQRKALAAQHPIALHCTPLPRCSSSRTHLIVAQQPVPCQNLWWLDKKLAVIPVNTGSSQWSAACCKEPVWAAGRYTKLATYNTAGHDTYSTGLGTNHLQSCLTAYCIWISCIDTHTHQTPRPPPPPPKNPHPGPSKEDSPACLLILHASRQQPVPHILPAQEDAHHCCCHHHQRSQCAAQQELCWLQSRQAVEIGVGSAQHAQQTTLGAPAPPSRSSAAGCGATCP